MHCLLKHDSTDACVTNQQPHHRRVCSTAGHALINQSLLQISLTARISNFYICSSIRLLDQYYLFQIFGWNFPSVLSMPFYSYKFFFIYNMIFSYGKHVLELFAAAMPFFCISMSQNNNEILLSIWIVLSMHAYVCY